MVRIENAMEFQKRVDRESAMAQTLLDAADIIENNGWAQDVWAKARNGRPVPFDHPGACKFCAISAIQKASLVGQRCNSEPSTKLAIKALRKQQGVKDASSPKRGELMVWNDNKGRTAAEVADLFRTAAYDLQPERRPE